MLFNFVSYSLSKKGTSVAEVPDKLILYFAHVFFWCPRGASLLFKTLSQRIRFCLHKIPHAKCEICHVHSSIRNRLLLDSQHRPRSENISPFRAYRMMFGLESEVTNNCTILHYTNNFVKTRQTVSRSVSFAFSLEIVATPTSSLSEDGRHSCATATTQLNFPTMTRQCDLMLGIFLNYTRAKCPTHSAPFKQPLLRVSVEQ
jgi:hypothetical protein